METDSLTMSVVNIQLQKCGFKTKALLLYLVCYVHLRDLPIVITVAVFHYQLNRLVTFYAKKIPVFDFHYKFFCRRHDKV